MVSVGRLLARYGYWAVFGAVFLEDFGLPVPGETMLIASSVVAAGGGLSLALLAPLAWAGAVLGDNMGFLIGRFGGRRLLLRYGRYVLITPRRLGRAERFFRRRGGWIVVLARFLEVLRQLNGVIAGMAGMPWRRFLLFNALGAALWVGFWSILAFELGRQVHRYQALLRRYQLPVVVGLLAVAAVTGVVLFLVRRRRARSGEGERDGSL